MPRWLRHQTRKSGDSNGSKRTRHVLMGVGIGAGEPCKFARGARQAIVLVDRAFVIATYVVC
jgi:hypothetical protein